LRARLGVVNWPFNQVDFAGSGFFDAVIVENIHPDVKINKYNKQKASIKRTYEYREF